MRHDGGGVTDGRTDELQGGGVRGICASLSIWRTGQTPLEGPAERHSLLFAGGGRLAREHHAARGWGSVRERHTRAGLRRANDLARPRPAPPMLSAAPKIARMGMRGVGTDYMFPMIQSHDIADVVLSPS